MLTCYVFTNWLNAKRVFLIKNVTGCKLYLHISMQLNRSQIAIFDWVRLNYATTHYHPTPSTTIHHHPKPAKISLAPPTTTHYQPKYIHHHPPPPTTSQNISTTTHNINHHSAKAKICSYITSFWHCFNRFFFFENKIAL